MMQYDGDVIRLPTFRTLREARAYHQEQRAKLFALFDAMCPSCRGLRKAAPLPPWRYSEYPTDDAIEAFKRWQSGPDCPVCNGTGER